MFETLDIAIGLVLVFTLVSLICSVLSEWISGILAMRGQMLWKGIQKMLGEPLSGQLCSHHLMQSLARGTWFDWLVGWLFKRSKPDYVPTQTFVLALLDVLGGHAAANAGVATAVNAAAAADLAAVRQAVTALPNGDVHDWLEARLDPAGAGAALGRALPADLKKLRETVKAFPAGAVRNSLLALVAPPEAGAVVGGAMPTDLAALRQTVTALPASGLRNALLALVDATGTVAAGAADTRLEAARQNIGQWYDTAMDRVTGSYKRWSQLVLFVLGFGVAACLGVDTVEIGKALQANPTLRAATVQAAQKWVADHPTLPASPAGGVPASLDTKSLQALKDQLTDVRDQLAGLDIPLSPWTHRPASQSFLQWLTEHLTGFLLAALAASLGAPFWFDLLNRFVNLRAAGKKPEPQTKTKG